ncbi:MAG: polysaccharide deacetylase family protein [Verrucomicrobiota bacterium]
MENHLTILLYHGVTRLRSAGIENYSGKHISENDFRQQMNLVSIKYHPLSIDEVVEIHEAGESYPANAVVVSFDDGFENNHDIAAPILSDLEVPAVFYLSTGIVGTGRMFWVDQIEDVLNRSEKEEIEIALGAEPISFSLGSQRLRIQALETIKDYCKRSEAAEKDRVVLELVEAAGVKPDVNASGNYKAMTWEKAKRLNGDPLFTVGGHTMNHNILTRLEPFEMEREITESLKAIRRETGVKPRHFSYPEGQADHFDEGVIECLKNSEVVCSPSAIDGVNRREFDLFNLRRIMPGFLGREFPLS